ncbi:MAG: PD-(D/E)XK nuclease family protein [Deltaproteobacteria bacterium]|nr:PD-(D/E)XK nuclease family protein [Deltaproteobacteria bacterium]
MGKIRFFLGRNIETRQQALRRNMTSADTRSFLHLVPTRGRVMELESENSFWLRRRADTLTGMIHRIFEEDIKHEKFQAYRFIDESLRLLLIKDVLSKRNLTPGGLLYFSSTQGLKEHNNDIRGICRAISDFFAQLVSNNLQDRFVQDLAGKIMSLEERAAGLGEERYALESDLVWLFGDYEEIKREIKGFDRDDILSHVKLFLDLGKIPSIVAKSSVIIFDGFDHLTRVEEDILFRIFQVTEVWWLLDYFEIREDLAVNGKSLNILMEAENDGAFFTEWKKRFYDRYLSFSSAGSLISRLEGAGVDFDFICADSRLSPINPGEAICFSDGKCEIPLHSLKIRAFPDRGDEVRAIAKEIKRIILEDGLDITRDLGRIRVVFPNLSEYSSLIFEIFQEYGIPFSLTKGMPLYSHPLAGLFCSIFEIPLNGFQITDIFRLFSSAILYQDRKNTFQFASVVEPFTEDFLLQKDDASKIDLIMDAYSGDIRSGIPDISFIDNVAKKCGLKNFDSDLSDTGGRWLSRIKDHFNEKLRDTERKEGEFCQEYYRFIIHAGILEKRLKLLREISNQQESGDIEEIFNRIIIDLGFPECLVGISKGCGSIDFSTMRKITKRDTKAFSLLMEIIKASKRELSLERSLSRIRGESGILSRFYSIFKSRLKDSFLLDERNPDVIRISQWLETRGRSFDYIFAGGLTADRFPLREEINFILQESPNRMARVIDPVQQSGYLFFQILRNYRKKLYLSYPVYTEERETRPSPVLDELADMAKSGGLGDDGYGSIEDFFGWADNPYLGARDEMLNAAYIKKRFDMPESDDPFSLKYTIVRPGFAIDELLKGINILLSRNSSDGLYGNDGIAKGSSVFESFLESQSSAISPSQMDNLANCPMRFLFQDIYKLKTREELGVELSPREMGVHLHAILKLFFKKLLERDMNVSDMDLENAFRLARRVVDEYLRQYPSLDAIEYFGYQIRDFLEGLEKQSFDKSISEKKNEGVFARLLRFEAKEFGRMNPGGVEIFFGHGDEPPVPLGKKRISGYIDRYDIDRENDDTVYIYDYKTGKVPPAIMVKKGLSFQLPSYMKAMKRIFGFKKIYASFYSLKKERFINDSPVMETLSENAPEKEGLDISGVCLIDDFADELFSLIKDGFFHHSADEMTCPFCDFRYACHRDTRRLNYLVDSGAVPNIYSGRKNFERWRKVDLFRGEWKLTRSSMKKAVDLKTSSARQRHYGQVMDFEKYLFENRHELPFYADYIDEILGKINEFYKNLSEDSMTT